MKRLLTLFLGLILISGNAFAISDWKQGSGTDSLPGSTTNASDIDYNVTNYLQNPLDKLLHNYIRGCTLTRTSASVITVSAGEVTCSNGAGTIKRMRQNTSTTTMDITVSGVGGLDNGAEAASTWYHIYAVADADATTFTAIASTSASAPTGITYYAYLGSVYNNSSSNFDNFYWLGTGQTCVFMWDIPVQITTTLSAGVWSAALSCSSAIPSTSNLGIFGVKGVVGTNQVYVWLRPNGSTWNTNVEDAVSGYDSAGQQRLCFTDASQQIQYQTVAGLSTVAISVEGFMFNR